MSAFEETKEMFKDLVDECLKINDISPLAEQWNVCTNELSDKRNILDCVLRENILNDCTTLDFIQRLVSLAIRLSQSELSSPSTPVLILSDFFEISTLDACENLFTFVEAHVSVWKDDTFFSSCKNNILRMCNDLLRRLSRSQNTVFRGRILLFLASFFPFSERSGLNVVSEFNLENTDRLPEPDEAIDINIDVSEEMETDPDEKKIKVDKNLYFKFLTLQDFFRNPTQCYNKLRWRDFALSWTDTFKTFEDYKLDAQTVAGKSVREHLDEAASGHVFFAKYLTNPRLLQLQLSDPTFRRSLLIQGLVTLQYLNSPVKFKQDGFDLRPVQLDWMRDQEAHLYNLLSETPKGSHKFRDMVKHILAREMLWNNWKNDGCPEFKKPGGVEEEETAKPAGPSKRLDVGRMIREATNAGKYYMGNAKLTRLWNVSPNNLEACKARTRDFLPTLDEYLGEAIEQMDSPSIEPQYKRVADANFSWRALRLLAHRAPCFFTNSNSSVAKIPEFIETSMRKMMKDRPSNTTTANATVTSNGGGTGSSKTGGQVEEVVIKDEVEMEQDGGTMETEADTEIETNGTSGHDVKRHRGDMPLPAEAARHLATLLTADQWRRLAAKLACDGGLDAAEGLVQWAAEDEDATPDNLAYTLEGMQFVEATAYLKENWCTPG